MTIDINKLDLSKVHPSNKAMLDAASNLLINAGAVPYNDLAKGYLELETTRSEAVKKHAAITKELDDMKASPMVRTDFVIGGNVKAPIGTGIPDGKVATTNAKKAFGMTGSEFNFDVPCFEWKTPHPLVPRVDESYMFDPGVLKELLYCLIHDKRAFLTGHTGTGKSSAIEQMCARLNWPLIRANFDSELTRMEVVGKEALRVQTDDDGKSYTITQFVETILPTAMRHGYVFLGDEWDSIRPDVAFVMQPVLEGKDLVLLEDESRVVPRHPMFRMFATGNTRGQGDDSGIYNGTRPQNAASMDRFEEWITMSYPSQDMVKKFIEAYHPDIPSEMRVRIAKFVREYWNGFERQEITTPLSYRGVSNICSRVMFGVGTGTDAKQAMNQAVAATCNNKASMSDVSVINGIISRVFAS